MPVTVPSCNVMVHQPTLDYTSATLQEGEGLKHWNVAKTRLSAGFWLLFKADWPDVYDVMMQSGKN